MKFWRVKFALACAALVLISPGARAAVGYCTNKDLGEELRGLAESRKELVRVESVARSLRSNDIWLVEIGVGAPEQRQQRPAMLLVGGIEGNDLAGTASALNWVRFLVERYPKDEKVKSLLESSTIYVFPRVNPDGAAFFFAKPRMETASNGKPVDDDRDGMLDEDGPEDLDQDGLITSMRVQDPDGEYKLDPAGPRLLMKADRKKGEKGGWRVLSEGTDNDKDEAWNEDGVGGVNFNRNFPFHYKYFGPSAGLHQVSERETRALADFVVSRPNIGIVFTFGAADNLVQTPKAEPAKRPPTTIHEEDIGFYRELGKGWRDALGLKKELSGAAEPGTFSDWMYFHRGRLSLAARAWSPAIQVQLGKKEEKKDEKKDEKPPDKPAAEKKEGDTRNEEERAFLKWLDENSPESFVKWKAFAHPDFPGKTVEIGGFAPYAKTNPPEKLLEELTRKQSQFLTELAGKLPRIGIRKAEAKHLGNGIYDVRVQVENSGYLPTALAQGSLTREVYPTRVTIKVDAKKVLSGVKTVMLGSIEGSGGSKEVRWIIHAGDQKSIDVDVTSMLGGSVKQKIDLKE